MNLRDFINELEKISAKIDRPEEVEVQMADTIPVVSPVFQDGVVYITDIEPEK